jgi:DNA-binding LytR/AlgR family response regulator
MNCIIVDDDEISRMVLRQLVKQVEHLNLVTVCTNPIDAINILTNGGIDLVFLDMEMPEMSGMEMLKVLKYKPQIIMTTSHKKYALEAYDQNVIDYLIKPITLPRFLTAMSKVKIFSKPQINTDEDFFFIKKNAVLNKVPIKDILWIEALDDYATVHTKDQQFIMHNTLKALESRLPANKFMRVHRSYIVHLDNIKQVEGTTIYINNTSIPVGVVYKDEFMKRLNSL